MEFVRVYFNAEKAASFLFLAVGVAALLFSAYSLLNLKRAFYTGMAYPLIFIGLIEIAVGVTIYWRTPDDVERVESYLSLEPERIQSEEIPRMEGVMKSLVVLRYVELTLIIVGVTMMFYLGRSDLVKGIGIGLFMQGAMMLTADYFAAHRGHYYLERLRQEVSSLDRQS